MVLYIPSVFLNKLPDFWQHSTVLNRGPRLLGRPFPQGKSARTARRFSENIIDFSTQHFGKKCPKYLRYLFLVQGLQPSIYFMYGINVFRYSHPWRLLFLNQFASWLSKMSGASGVKLGREAGWLLWSWWAARRWWPVKWLTTRCVPNVSPKISLGSGC